MKTLSYGVLLLTLAVSACDGKAPNTDTTDLQAPLDKAFRLTSPAFSDGQPLPAVYTADGADVSPPLRWTGVPKGTLSLALVVDDPDAPAGTWTHWLIYDIAPATPMLPEAVGTTGSLPDGAHQGVNDFHKIGYGGPSPPPGPPHRYRFTLFALDTKVGLPEGGTREALFKAMEGHVLARAVLTGTYGR